MMWSYSVLRLLVIRKSLRMALLQGKGRLIEGKKRAAICSKGSPARQTRLRPWGLTFVKTLRIRFPWVGEEGKLSTCNRASSLRQEMARPSIWIGRKLVRARINPLSYGEDNCRTR